MKIKVKKFNILVAVLIMFAICTNFSAYADVPLGNGKLPDGTGLEKVQAKKLKPYLSPSDNSIKTESIVHPKLEKFSNNNDNTASYNEDWSKYMRSMQRSIRMNWNPPKSPVNQHVVVKFRLLKDGRLQYCNIYKSSGNKQYDLEAINTIKKTTFEKLPYNKQYTDMQFTFDYNVFEAEKLK